MSCISYDLSNKISYDVKINVCVVVGRGLVVEIERSIKLLLCVQFQNKMFLLDEIKAEPLLIQKITNRPMNSTIK